MRKIKCPYFKKCGGCSFLDLSYKDQLRQKISFLEKLFNLKIKSVPGPPLFYRNRMDFVFHENGLGLREKGKWYKVVDIKRCLLANKKINQLLKELRAYFKGIDYFNLKTQKGTFRYAVIRAPDKTSSISFVLNKESSNLKDSIQKIKEFSKRTSADIIAASFVPPQTDLSISSEFKLIKGTEFLKEFILRKKFFFHFQGFFQINSKIANKIHFYSRKLLSKILDKESTLLDLYAGVGTFGINNADLVKEVIFVENDKNSIKAAELNLKVNKIKNGKILEVDARDLNLKLLSGKKLFIITDPPRAGMHPKVLEKIEKLNPFGILYISCNPQRTKKELSYLSSFFIKRLIFFDMFPFTPHMELILYLKNKKKVL